MPIRPLTFERLASRLRMFGVDVVASPPAPEGSVWLFGKAQGTFPFNRGPLYPMRARADGELIPAKMVAKILRHLRMTHEETREFWNIEDAASASTLN